MKKYTFFALAVELDVGREADGAQSKNRKISRPRRPPPRCVDLPFKKSLDDKVASLKRASSIFTPPPKRPSFFDPAVELDVGRRADAAHRTQESIPRPRRPPPRGSDLPFGRFGQTKAGTNGLIKNPETHPSSPYAIII